MSRCFLIFFLNTLWAPTLFAQPKAPSPSPLFQQQLADNSANVKRLNSHAEKIQFSNPETAIETLGAAITMATTVKDSLGLSIAYGLRAGLLFYEMKLDSAQLLLNKAYALVKDNKENTYRNQAANLLNKYAAIDQRRQNFDMAVERYQGAANIFNETGERLKIIFTYYNLAGIYKFLGDTTRMFFYARESNRLAVLSKDSVSIVRGLIALGDAFSVVKKYDSVLLIAKRGLSMARNQDLTFAMGIFNNYLGLYYSNKALKYDSAIFHFNEALAYFENINIQYDIALVYQNMGNAYLLKKDYSTAVTFLMKAVALAEKLNLDQVLYASLKDLVAAEEAKGNLAESYKYLQYFVAINDSIQNKNNRKKVYELESRYQAQQKEMMLFAQQKIIERKNLLNSLLASGLLSLCIIVVLLYRNHQNKQALQQQRIADLETEKKLMATEAVLKGEEQERTRLAQDLHDGLGGMLSGIKFSFNTVKGQLLMTAENTLAFERSMDMLDGSIGEMRRVAHNMMPETLVKFGLNTALKDFCNDINQSGALQLSYQSIGMDNAEIDSTTSITIYRIVQELINNTMKHAGASTGLVQVSLLQQKLALTVEDDGQGFDLTMPKGMGLRNVRNRVEFLKGTLDVKTEKNKGTSVHIEVNLS